MANFDKSLLLPVNDFNGKGIEVFSALISNLKDGMTFTLTKKDIAPYDDFLIFSACRKQTITIHTSCPFWVEFDGDEPMLLENCPVSFYRTLLMNIDKGNYTIKNK